MVFRRASFYWQFAAAVLLPVWVLVGRGILGSDVGWDFLFYLVVCPILCVAMLAVVGATVARKGVRTTRALSWQDVAVLLPWHAAILAYGFFASSLIAVAVVLLGIAAFWSAAWQLYSETRTRVKNAFSLDAVDTGTYRAEGYRPGDDAGRVIVITPEIADDEPPRR
jgi:hypothetical protein